MSIQRRRDITRAVFCQYELRHSRQDEKSGNKYTVKSELSVRKPADSMAKDQKTVDHPYKANQFLLLPGVAEASLL